MKKLTFAAALCLTAAFLTSCGTQPIENNDAPVTVSFTGGTTTTAPPLTVIAPDETLLTVPGAETTAAADVTTSTEAAATTSSTTTTTTTTNPITTTTTTTTTTILTTTTTAIPAPTADQVGGEYDASLGRYVKRISLPVSHLQELFGVTVTPENAADFAKNYPDLLMNEMLKSELQGENLIVTIPAENYNKSKRYAVPNLAGQLKNNLAQGRYQTVTDFYTDERGDNVTVTVKSQNDYLNSADGLKLIADISLLKYEMHLFYDFSEKVTMHIKDGQTGKEFVVKELNT